MKRKDLYIKPCFILGIFLLIVRLSYSQLTSNTADFSVIIDYPFSPGKDSLFVFYSPGAAVKKGSLSAKPEKMGLYNFSWSKYNPSTSSFDIPFQIQLNIPQSTISELNPGGYKVRIWNGTGTDTICMGWVMADGLKTSILKNSEGKVYSSKYTCDYITLNGDIDSAVFIYYDTLTNTSVHVQSGYTFLWTSDNPDLIIPWPDTSLVSNTSYNPPYRDTWYFLTATDKLGMKSRDSVLYESIVVKPDFSFQVYDKTDKKDFIDPADPVEDDAPLRVRFTNKSINGATFEWIFSDPVRSEFFANEITQDFNYLPEFTYKIPDDYYPAIIVTSEEGCVDSFRVANPITIRPSLLEVPNVFTPDGDSNNDYFKVKHQSIREFSLRIYNRNGRLVYKADIKDLYSWEGWDGKVMNTGNPASPGAYYYVIEAIGYDREKYQKGRYAGVVYLFRE